MITDDTNMIRIKQEAPEEEDVHTNGYTDLSLKSNEGLVSLIDEADMRALHNISEETVESVIGLQIKLEGGDGTVHTLLPHNTSSEKMLQSFQGVQIKQEMLSLNTNSEDINQSVREVQEYENRSVQLSNITNPSVIEVIIKEEEEEETVSNTDDISDEVTHLSTKVYIKQEPSEERVENLVPLSLEGKVKEKVDSSTSFPSTSSDGHRKDTEQASTAGSVWSIDASATDSPTSPELDPDSESALSVDTGDSHFSPLLDSDSESVMIIDDVSDNPTSPEFDSDSESELTMDATADRLISTIFGRTSEVNRSAEYPRRKRRLVKSKFEYSISKCTTKHVESDLDIDLCAIGIDNAAESDSITHMESDDKTRSSEDKTRSSEDKNDITNYDIKVMCSNNSERRKFDKGAYCPFCHKLQMKLTRHLVTKEHRQELRVIQWLNTSDPVLKLERLTKMRNLGNFYHNAQVFKEGKGTIIPVYRPTHEANYKNYVPCMSCFGFFAKADLWKHSCKVKKCTQDSMPTGGKKKKRRMINLNSFLLPTTGDASERVNKIFSSMREDGVSALIKGDMLVKKLAKKLAFNLGQEEEHFHQIKGKLRNIGRMVLAYREITNEKNASLKDVIDPVKFRNVVKASRYAARFKEKEHVLSPSFSLKMRYTVKQAAGILLGIAVCDGDEVLETRAANFIKLCEFEWTDQMAFHSLHAKKFKNPNYLSLTNDVMKLSIYLNQKVQEGKKVLHQSIKDVSGPFRELSELILTSVLVFNRKRSGEMSKIKVSDYDECVKGEYGKDMLGGLTEFEKQLCRVLWVLEISGEDNRKVPVLLTQDVKEAMNLLRRRRKDAGVLDENQFFFPLLNSTGHIRGSDVISKHAGKCGAKHPENIQSILLRQHIATIYQVMNLRKNEQDILSLFLGIRIPHQHFGLPEGAIQVAKILKSLFLMENGAIPIMAGQTMDEIQVDEVVPMAEPMDEAPDHMKDGLLVGDDTQAVVQTTFTNASKSLAKKEATKNSTAKETMQQPKKATKKQKWTYKEKLAVATEFRSYMTSSHVKKLPGKAEIETVLSKTPSLSSRTWRNVKDYIRNNQTNAYSGEVMNSMR